MWTAERTQTKVPKQNKREGLYFFQFFLNYKRFNQIGAIYSTGGSCLNLAMKLLERKLRVRYFCDFQHFYITYYINVELRLNNWLYFRSFPCFNPVLRLHFGLLCYCQTHFCLKSCFCMFHLPPVCMLKLYLLAPVWMVLHIALVSWFPLRLMNVYFVLSAHLSSETNELFTC